MKQILKIAAFSLALVLSIACEKDYVAPDNELVDVSWYTSEGPNSDYILSSGDYISFMDLSQWTLSHKWIIEEGSGTEFMYGDFYGDDSMHHYIDPSKGYESSEAIVHVLFQDYGVHSVQLYNEFPQKVSYSAEMPLDAVLKGDVWVIDTTITVDIYGPLFPKYKIYKVLADGSDSLVIDSEVDSYDVDDNSNWPVVNLEAGMSLKYVDMTTTDRPTGRTWSVNSGSGNVTYTDSIALITFMKLGNGVAGSLKATRGNADVESDIPTAQVTRKITLKTLISASSAPYEISGPITEAYDESITFNLGGEIATMTGAMKAFTVHASNTAFDQELTIASVTIDEDDKSLITIVLSDPIYNTDVVTISYDNTLGDIQSTDARTLSSFTDEVVEMYKYNVMIVDAGGFETLDVGTTDYKKGFCSEWWVGNNNRQGSEADYRYLYQRSTAKSSLGNASMLYTATADDTDALLDFYCRTATNASKELYWTDPLAAPSEAGIYEMQVDVYIPAATTGIDILSMRFGKTLYASESLDLTTVVRDQWVTLTFYADLSKDPTSDEIGFRVLLAENPNLVAGDQIYVDNLRLAAFEQRP